MTASLPPGIELDIPVARAFLPLLGPARYKGAHGGRGSGKSHFFAGNVVRRCVTEQGVRVVCLREVQKSLKESAKKLIEDKIEEYGVGHLFRIKENEIVTPGGGLIIFQGLQDHTAESIKSLEGFDIAWVEEAQTISKRSLQLLRPTIRAEGSELWFSWNPRFESDAVDVFLRQQDRTGAVVVEANWSDNPWFPAELEQERQDDLREEPDQYDHIWEGDYVTVVEGAYFAQKLTVARAEGRIGLVPRDELFNVKLFIDIGGTGQKSDAFSMWASQWIGATIRHINYYEAVGQPIDEHLAWMKLNRYDPSNTEIYLPHDGVTGDRVHAVSYESAFRKLGYTVHVIKNQGTGAAMMRISAVRRHFSRMWFHEAPKESANDDIQVPDCSAGIKAIGWYHPKLDPDRQIDLGPDHDWSSHAADALGLEAIAYVEPRTNQQTHKEFRRKRPSNWRL